MVLTRSQHTIDTDSSDTDEERLVSMLAEQHPEVADSPPVKDVNPPALLGGTMSREDHLANIKMLVDEEGLQGYDSAEDPDYVASSGEDSSSSGSSGGSDSRSEGCGDNEEEDTWRNELLYGMDGYLSAEDPDWEPPVRAEAREGRDSSDDGESEPSDAEDLDATAGWDEGGVGDSEYDSENDSAGSLADFICDDEELECEDDYDPEQDHLNWGRDHERNFKRLKRSISSDGEGSK